MVVTTPRPNHGIPENEPFGAVARRVSDGIRPRLSSDGRGCRRRIYCAATRQNAVRGGARRVASLKPRTSSELGRLRRCFVLYGYGFVEDYRTTRQTRSTTAATAAGEKAEGRYESSAISAREFESESRDRAHLKFRASVCILYVCHSNPTCSRQLITLVVSRTRVRVRAPPNSACTLSLCGFNQSHTIYFIYTLVNRFIRWTVSFDYSEIQ